MGATSVNRLEYNSRKFDTVRSSGFEVVAVVVVLHSFLLYCNDDDDDDWGGCRGYIFVGWTHVNV